ncbi:7400_t:CDS:2, partial [Acaulospora colombiana]
DELKQIATEHRRLAAEKDALEGAHQALMEEHTQLRNQYDDLKVENEELNLKSKDLELVKTEIETLRHELQNLEQENQSLIERNRVIEDEYHKIAASKSSENSRTQQVADFQLEKIELISQRNKYEHECKHLRAKIEAYEVAKSRDMDTIRLLEDRLRELELGEGLTDEASQSICEISGASKDDTTIGLKLNIKEPESELVKYSGKDVHQSISPAKTDPTNQTIISLEDSADDWEYL